MYLQLKFELILIYNKASMVQWFQKRRFKCENLRHKTDGRQVMAKAHMAFAR